nr:MAG TPA: restriction alleviation protein [Caudoviricetes sp.]
MQNKLKPCPFCGGEAEIVPHKFFSEILKAWKVDCYGVECPCQNPRRRKNNGKCI